MPIRAFKKNCDKPKEPSNETLKKGKMLEKMNVIKNIEIPSTEILQNNKKKMSENEKKSKTSISIDVKLN